MAKHNFNRCDMIRHINENTSRRKATGKSNRTTTGESSSDSASTPATPSAGPALVENVEGVEETPRKPQYVWMMEAGLDNNFRQVGRLLTGLRLPIFRRPEGGLVLVEEDRPRHITSAKEMAPLLIDHVRIAITKSGKYHGERVPDSVLNNMLAARSFLSNFREVEDVVTTPIVLADYSVSRPGYNDVGGLLYLGSPVQVSAKVDTIRKFLDVMEWQSDADRTNAVAALLTVPFRFHFPGGKPFVLITANKSHGGKGTLVEFVRGKTAKAEISYEDKDWPMQRNLHDQLVQKPEIGVVNFDNVRTDSSGRAKIIRSGFLESFITQPEIVLSSATARSKPVRTANRYVVLLNTNEGSLSIDLLNRSLPIRLSPTGDLSERITKAKTVLGGDVKHEWLPASRDQIEAELWGMIERWRKEGRPFDNDVKHPMGPWAQTIGGILMANGFTDFLRNYSPTRAAADPTREAIAILAFRSGGKPRRAAELAKLAVTEGLGKVLLSGADTANQAACERAMGVTLRSYVGETFVATTASEKVTYRLRKESKRWDGAMPHFRYTFEEVGRGTVAPSDLDGLVLEERSLGFEFPTLNVDLEQYHPEEVP